METKILEKVSSVKIGKSPVVVLPMNVWREIEEKLEELSMLNAVGLRKKIAKARLEKKTYSLAQVKKILAA